MNYARFWALFNKLPQANEGLKESLVLEFTSNRTSSLREMKKAEYYSLIVKLEDLNKSSISSNRRYELLRKERSNTLHLMQKMGVNTSEWGAVDRYLLDPRISGKRFRDLTTDELQEVRLRLHAINRKNNI